MGKYDWTKKSGNVKTRHIEIEGAVVNIYTGLKDLKGRKVSAVEIIPDEYAGEKPWKVVGSRHTRIIQLKGKIGSKTSSKKHRYPKPKVSGKGFARSSGVDFI